MNVLAYLVYWLVVAGLMRYSSGPSAPRQQAA
jgi:hypothetical protein